MNSSDYSRFRYNIHSIWSGCRVAERSLLQLLANPDISAKILVTSDVSSLFPDVGNIIFACCVA